MKCAQARGLFGASWDDDLTQAEREWLDAHLSTCAPCRLAYEEFAKVLEWTASLPRAEASPDLVERTLVAARRAATVADRLPTTGVPWVPITATAALMLIVGILVSPWVGLGPKSQTASRRGDQAVVREAELVGTVASRTGPAPSPTLRAPSASVSDSLFDHSEDVEFILDPVTLRRGRASVTHPPANSKAAQAIITF